MHYVNEILKVKCVEYADDIVFFSENKETLHYVLQKVKEYFKTLKIQVKSNH